MTNKIISELIKEYPFVINYFEENGIDINGNEHLSFKELIGRIDEEEVEDMAIDQAGLLENLDIYIDQMKSFLGVKEESGVGSLTILPGKNKLGQDESFGDLTIESSQIISIVGPTGSGKSRLLADIEWTANADTPTGRTILINGDLPDKKWRFSSNNKLVAQLSQNMNFVMDLTVMEFLRLHAESRMVLDIENTIEKIIERANNLAGEKFALDTPITALSGGQSRALMIADTAILSSSPIVLIDEIENAGIDRRKALNLLLDENKIVLMATHDPTLALFADKRIVIKNGGIEAIIETSPEEKEVLKDLEKMDEYIQAMRTSLRQGESLKR